MKFFILTCVLARVHSSSYTAVNDGMESYESRDIWYSGGKLTITAYEKEGIGYIRFKGVHNWSFKWDKCNGSTRFLIR